MDVKQKPLEVCLFQPLIPQNTGNIARLTAATCSHLHLIKPLGFSLDDKMVRRAGLDYWPYVKLSIHEDLDSLLSLFGLEEIAFFSTKAQPLYNTMPHSVRLLVFGQETTGLPADLREKFPDQFYRIPILNPGVRSLNLANSVGIILYHQLLQRGSERILHPTF